MAGAIDYEDNITMEGLDCVPKKQKIGIALAQKT
jgi:hypothetical protein